jgi:hypothetical protein
MDKRHENHKNPGYQKYSIIIRIIISTDYGTVSPVAVSLYSWHGYS